MLLVFVLLGFSVLLLRVLNLGLFASLLFLSIFVFGMAIGDLLLVKQKLIKPWFALFGLAITLGLTALRSSVNTSPLELAIYLALSGVAFGINLFQLRVQKNSLIVSALVSVLIFGFGLSVLVNQDFAPRATSIKATVSNDERAQLEVMNIAPRLTGLNPNDLKKQLQTNLKDQFSEFQLLLSKNDLTAKQKLLSNTAIPSQWRFIIEGGGLKAVSDAHFAQQKIDLEKAFRDEDPKAIEDLLSSKEIPNWVRESLAKGGLKDWVHRKFDVQRLQIENAIQNSDAKATASLLKNPQIRPELRVLLEQGGVRASIQKRLVNLRSALKKAIQIGDPEAVSLVFQHPLTPKRIKDIFVNGALQPQTQLELDTQHELIVKAFLKADPQAMKGIQELGLVAQPKLPADITVVQQTSESRAQLAIKSLLKQAQTIRKGFLTRRTLFDRALQNGDLTAIKILCPTCQPAVQPVKTSTPTIVKPKPETSVFSDSVKSYLQNGGLRAQIAAKYKAQYQTFANAINSGDIAKILNLLEKPNLPSEISDWITGLNLENLATPEAQTTSLKQIKEILDRLQQTETRTAALAALTVIRQELTNLEMRELNTLIEQQVITDALTEALPIFDASAKKIEARAIDRALQGAFIGLTVSEKAAGNNAVQTLIDRAQKELSRSAPKTIDNLLKTTLKTAQNDSQIMQRKLEHGIDALTLAEKETFATAIRNIFEIMAIIAFLIAGLVFVGLRRDSRLETKRRD